MWNKIGTASAAQGLLTKGKQLILCQRVPAHPMAEDWPRAKWQAGARAGEAGRNRRVRLGASVIRILRLGPLDPGERHLARSQFDEAPV